MRFSLTDSISKKIFVLYAIGVLSSAFVMIMGLVSLSVMERVVGMEKGLHDHTVMHYESFVELERYLATGDKENYSRFRSLRSVCMGITMVCAQAAKAVNEGTEDELVDRFLKISNEMSADEVNQLMDLFRYMEDNQYVRVLSESTKRSTELDQILLDLTREFHDSNDPEARMELTSRIRKTIDELNQAKEEFGEGLAGLSNWATSVTKKIFIVSFLILTLIGMGLAYAMGRSLVRPILKIVAFSDRVSQGALDGRLELDTRDETRRMAGAVNAICEALARVVIQVRDGADSLTDSSRDLSTMATQFSSTASETSASVTQINVTSTELRQAVQSSSENADQVVASAESTALAYEEGKSATNAMGDGMDIITRQVVEVGESVANLSAQAVRISEIIDMVDEVAHQSELLSVNASIEAAKAGEFGKGFQVVAAEVKTLSEQSKGATRQVRSILKEIQAAADTAIKAAEKCSLSAQEGEGLNNRTLQAINKLAQNIDAAVDSSRKIAATSRQELQGVEQVTDALSGIQDAMESNTKGAHAMEDRIKELVSLAEALKGMLAAIKV
ncbi:Protein with methyl-accepting chemotaxis protein (MCP) signaling domain [Desulfatibacillum aliphaticivorans]|uniref:Protein with methyl-accepting chemotaxis protein (MCP) signaling domain n=1 Tax=Desulfatibacillum aliphaticivorans TaxID=218208 RepID=B8FKA5_DESAL|nr:methyl-accepting chemotaxis protein [Desulfatibacillum aliphaticivorans]ACL02780.1 Protein with methyl-accepting chemotaxis protein (MCP) signaling domain [Desulfatibacillum aliphaticivorans]